MAQTHSFTYVFSYTQKIWMHGCFTHIFSYGQAPLYKDAFAPRSGYTDICLIKWKFYTPHVFFIGVLNNRKFFHTAAFIHRFVRMFLRTEAFAHGFFYTRLSSLKPLVRYSELTSEDVIEIPTQVHNTIKQARWSMQPFRCWARHEVWCSPNFPHATDKDTFHVQSWGLSEMLESIGTLTYQGETWRMHSKASTAIRIPRTTSFVVLQELKESRTPLLSIYNTAEPMPSHQ